MRYRKKKRQSQFHMSWQERKNARIEYFKKYIWKWKLRPCVARNGSGRYDNNGSPPCGACNGTGHELYNSNKEYYNGTSKIPESNP